jgi:hypothetical protein
MAQAFALDPLFIYLAGDKQDQISALVNAFFRLSAADMNFR